MIRGRKTMTIFVYIFSGKVQKKTDIRNKKRAVACCLKETY